jgi:hypothetical protein
VPLAVPPIEPESTGDVTSVATERAAGLAGLVLVAEIMMSVVVVKKKPFVCVG